MPGSRHEKRYQDVLRAARRRHQRADSAVNIQHLETLNDAVSRVTGVRVRETVPDTFLDRADEVINVDVTVEELRTRLRQGKVYKPEKVEQALQQLLPRGESLDAARAGAARGGRRGRREGRVVPAARRTRARPDPGARDGVHELERERAARDPGRARGSPSRLGARWYAVYVETPRELPARISGRPIASSWPENIALAESLGATVVRATADRPADGLIAFAQREGITHVIFGQIARTRMEILMKGSTLNRFLEEVKDAAVQVVPL